MARLTPAHKRFVDEYLIDLNATRAYMVAYPRVKNADVASAAASRLLANVKVSEYLKERQQELQRRTEITVDRVLGELAKVAFSNGTDFAQVVEKTRKLVDGDRELVIPYKDVEVIETSKLDDDKKAAIAGIKSTQYGIEVKMNDKVRALELIGNHLGMFNNKPDANVPVTVVINYDYGPDSEND